MSLSPPQRVLLPTLWLMLAAGLSPAADADTPPAPLEIASWWVSPGERASLEVIRRHAQTQGLRWQQRIVAGSGTRRYGDVLKRWVAENRAPMASQVIGYDIHDWARQAQLAFLDDVATAQEWDEVVPLGIQQLSKYQGHWVAAPINAHSTNWLWINARRLRQLKADAPDSWPDLLRLLDAAQKAGITPLAIGTEAWEHTLLFEAVAAGAGGAEFYRRAFLELDSSALDDSVLPEIFQRMRLLRHYAKTLAQTPSWDKATEQVRRGEALLQVQGTWVDGEFSARQLKPDEDYACFRFPDTQGMFIFNADQYMFFKHTPEPARQRFARVLLDPAMQAELNIATGAAPARVDVPQEKFNACGQKAIRDMRRANLQRTLMGSIAMGNANPPAVKNAIYAVVSAHFLGRIDDATAITRLRQAIAGAGSGKHTPVR
ncbi:ABC transporter substrate-binding protein [Azonexus sp.]|uniref:ABC transporter substrate-binding protein n=1 Tax=Azonexus sp. TaxID=1872668 RepID=UPI0039E55802